MKTGIIVALFGALSLTTVACKDKGTPETVAPDTAAPTETPAPTEGEAKPEGETKTEGEEADAE